MESSTTVEALGTAAAGVLGDMIRDAREAGLEEVEEGASWCYARPRARADLNPVPPGAKRVEGVDVFVVTRADRTSADGPQGEAQPR